MNKNILIGVIVLVVVLGGGYFVLNSQKAPKDSITTEKTSEKEMMGAPEKDAMMKEVGEEDAMMMKEMIYQYEGVLSDVTKGEVRGINTNGQATGVAKSNFSESTYSLLATFENLPDPAGDDFYEGWIVQKSPFKFLSSGKVNKVDGVWTNTYKSGEDLTNYNFYVLTIEPNDNDPAPADHIVEGTME